MWMRGDRDRSFKRTSMLCAAGVLLALGARGATAQLYQGNAATIRPGEIADGMFAASNAFAEGTEITVRNLESGTAVEVEVVARANGGLVLLLLAPAAANALGIDAGEIVPVDAQLTSVAVDPGAQAADPSSSNDPDVDPSVGLPSSLSDYLASLPPIDAAGDTAAADATDTAEGAEATEGDGVDTAQEAAADGAATAAEPRPPASAAPTATGTAVPPTTYTAAIPPELAAARMALPSPTLDDGSLATTPPRYPADDELMALLAVPEPTRDAVARAEPTAELPLAVTRVVLVEPTEPRPPSAVADSPPMRVAGEALAVAPALPATPDARDATAADLAAAPSLPLTSGVDAVGTPPELTSGEVSERPHTGAADPVAGGALLTLAEPAVATAIATDPSHGDAAMAATASDEPDLGEAVVTAPPDQQVAAPIEVAADVAVVGADVADSADVAIAAAGDGTATTAAVETTAATEPTAAAAATGDALPLGLAGTGALGPPPSIDGPVYLLQLGAYASQSGAQNVAMRVPRSFAPAVVGSEGARPIFKVLIGPLNRDESGTLLYRFRASGFPDAFLVPVAVDELARGPR